MKTKKENFIEKYLPMALVRASNSYPESENIFRNMIVDELEDFSKNIGLYKSLYFLGRNNKEASFKCLINSSSSDCYLKNRLGGTDICISDSINVSRFSSSQDEIGSLIGIEVKAFKEKYSFNRKVVNTSEFFTTSNISALHITKKDTSGKILNPKEQFQNGEYKITHNLCGQFLGDICRGVYIVNLEKYVSNKFYFCGVIQTTDSPDLAYVQKNMENLVRLLRAKDYLYYYDNNARDYKIYFPCSLLSSVTINLRILESVKYSDNGFNVPYWGWVESLGRYTSRHSANL